MGYKIWCLAVSVNKYIWNFDVYCGKFFTRVGDVAKSNKVGVGMGHKVVRDFMGLEGRGHVIVIDNFFTSVPLLRELLFAGLYTTRTARGNRIGLPIALTK